VQAVAALVYPEAVMQILTDESAFASVRNLVQIGLTAEDLPSDKIADPAIGGATEALVLARIPDYDALDSAEKDRVRNAVIYLTAATILESMPLITTEAHGDEHSYTVNRITTDKRILSLRARADEFLVDVVAAPTYRRSTMFAVAPARRVRGF
jgi:hypothetical protein